jgi:type II secretory pathway pseudopilin PulG
LIEVLLAVVLLGLVVGSLVVSVQQNLAALVGAREELERLRLAELELRELEAQVAAGTPPTPGRSRGSFDPPDDGYAWELVVEPWAVPLPQALLNYPPLSSVFATARDPATGFEPSVQRVELRVFPVDGAAEEVDPFVTLLVTPVPPELAAAQAAAAGATPPPPEGTPPSTPSTPRTSRVPREGAR